ncbi:MAG: putative two-component histidine kinase [Fusobacteria bacterium]|nr:MAG: putative two-component histidine kinase [Fusobacteriota bacterium]KAF0230226.1 MAG: putative two-component histidine [Fusobacteriota bacterium]
MRIIDQMWVLICALFVFFMQAGFICYEVGFIRPKNVVSVAIENIIAFVITTLSFFAVGYAIMFGPSFHGLFGSDFWFGSHLQGSSSYVIVFFELMFAGTAVTIFSGSMSERTKTKGLIISAIVVGALIYPVYGHWVWGNLYLNQSAWLQQLGFIDFAGATVVHGTAGWIALAGVLVVGPRKGRWDANGRIKNLGRSNIPFAALGTFILWFSWFGFNGGSLMRFDDSIGQILMNTNISASAGVLGAVCTVFFILKNRSFMEAIFSGALGGLVAITASSNILEPIQAFFVGLITGIIVILGSALLEKLRIDDAVGAISIHAFGSVSGILLLALFANQGVLSLSNRWWQLGIQIFGVLVNFVWVFGMSYIMFKIIDKFIGLRVTPEEEEQGLNIVEYSDLYSWQQAIKDRTYTEITDELYLKIQQQNQELEKKSQRLMATQEKERDKIARDLHDGVGQLLAASKIDLGQLKKKLISDGQKDQATRIMGLIDNTVDEIRTVIYNLKPIKLEEEGLLKSIQKLTSQIQKIKDLVFEFQIISPLPLLGEIEMLNVYRIVQESLSNILKHSEADKVILIFDKDKHGSYIISIEDNGIGFDINNIYEGMGMTTMLERTKLLGGKLNIKSQNGKGTKITLEMPYEN